MKLVEELGGAPKEGEPSSHVYAPFLPAEEPWSYEGIFAIAARFEEDAITLEQWLTHPEISQTDTVQEVFDELFLQGLKKAYVEGKSVSGSSAMTLLKPAVSTRARTLISLDSILPLLKQQISSFDPDLVHNFVRLNGQIRTQPAALYPSETRICWSHGDLHTRNILIDPLARSRPKLIDTAKRGEHHWASDPSRLCADLWLSAWDRNPESHFWERLSTWREHFRSWRQDGIVAAVPMTPNHRVGHALNWMRQNLGMLFDLTTPECAKWQFDLALVLQLLSLSSFTGVPMPKRCFGVLAANDILIDLDLSIPWR